MAKRYIITEAQYKSVLSKLNLNEDEIREFQSFDDHQEPTDQPGYAIISVYKDDLGGEPMLTVEWEQEGSKAVFKGSLPFSDVQEMGLNPDDIINKFAETLDSSVVPDQLDHAVWEVAEYAHDGQDDSDFEGN